MGRASRSSGPSLFDGRSVHHGRTPGPRSELMRSNARVDGRQRADGAGSSADSIRWGSIGLSPTTAECFVNSGVGDRSPAVRAFAKTATYLTHQHRVDEIAAKRHKRRKSLSGQTVSRGFLSPVLVCDFCAFLRPSAWSLFNGLMSPRCHRLRKAADPATRPRFLAWTRPQANSGARSFAS